MAGGLRNDTAGKGPRAWKCFRVLSTSDLKKGQEKRATVGKIIDMATRGEIVAYLPTKTVVDKRDLMRDLAKSIADAERLLALIEQAPAVQEERMAFHAFMSRLEPTIRECSDRVKVISNVSWIKIEGLTTRHKVYISKGKLAVNRVDSTLPPEAVPGAVVPTGKNGRIASWLPADAESVAYAVRLISSDETPPRKKR